MTHTLTINNAPIKVACKSIITLFSFARAMQGCTEVNGVALEEIKFLDKTKVYQIPNKRKNKNAYN